MNMVTITQIMITAVSKCHYYCLKKWGWVHTHIRTQASRTFSRWEFWKAMMDMGSLYHNNQYPFRLFCRSKVHDISWNALGYFCWWCCYFYLELKKTFSLKKKNTSGWGFLILFFLIFSFLKRMLEVPLFFKSLDFGWYRIKADGGWGSGIYEFLLGKSDLRMFFEFSSVWWRIRWYVKIPLWSLDWSSKGRRCSRVVAEKERAGDFDGPFSYFSRIISF